MQHKPYLIVGLLVSWLIAATTAAARYPLGFQDAGGQVRAMRQPPQRVVSIVPSVTEILFGIGAGDAVVGVTYHDVYPPQAATKAIVGGFFSPALERIDALTPELIFLDDLHESIAEAYAGKDHPRLMHLPLATFDDLYQTIRLLGDMFGRQAAAERLIGRIRTDLDHTAKKVASIPANQRKRVMRLMGTTRVMTPGKGSFQNDMIRRAGGIPPTLAKPGSIVPMTLQEWQMFNPQVIYGCGTDREAALAMLDRPGWREVDAVKNGRLIDFPCDLTCRLSTRSGYFVSCLASRIYADELAHQPPMRPDGRMASRPLPLALDYVDRAAIVESVANDYVHKTLLIHLALPMSVTSTLEGFRDGIRHVGNSYSPPQVWGLSHRIGLQRSRSQLMRSIGREPTDTSLLFTGADMDNLSIQRQQFKQMNVYALVTAGVRSNAVRMAEDIGSWYEPGTINMILLTNMRLTPRAMQRAIISATEAKTAALLDMDIRSAYTPLTHPATGTGTDNIIVVQGTGPRIDNAGGHSKMGELIAKAVYAGVQEAVFEQNGIVPRRNVFQRLKERKIGLFGLVGDCACGLDSSQLARELEALLLDPQYAGFIEAALAISDQYERGLISDIRAFNAWCDQISVKIAGHPIGTKRTFGDLQALPPVIRMAFDALLNGVYGRWLPEKGVN